MESNRQRLLNKNALPVWDDIERHHLLGQSKARLKKMGDTISKKEKKPVTTSCHDAIKDEIVAPTLKERIFF